MPNLVQGIETGGKQYERTIKKWSQDGKASWHWLLMDVVAFWKARWEGAKIDSKMGQHKAKMQDAAKLGQDAAN